MALFWFEEICERNDLFPLILGFLYRLSLNRRIFLELEGVANQALTIDYWRVLL